MELVFRFALTFFARSNPHQPHDAHGRSRLFHARRCVIDGPPARQLAGECGCHACFASLTPLGSRKMDARYEPIAHSKTF